MPQLSAVLPANVFPFLVDIGPYRFRIEVVPKAALKRKNENSETDYNAEVIRIADHLNAREQLIAFLRRIVFILHYTHGLDDTSVEECYTHSFATGLLEFAARNEAAWAWVNRMFTQLSSSQENFELYASGQRSRRRGAPRSVMLQGRLVRLGALSAAKADRENVWGYYTYADKEVRLHEELQGRHLSVIFLHELTHAFHHRAKMKNRETRRRFVRTQVDLWMRFVKDNPSAWTWFLCSLCSRRARATEWPDNFAR